MEPARYIRYMHRARYLVANARRKRGLNQSDVAQAAGISRKHLSEIERGRSRPSADVLFAIAAALRAELRELREVE